MNKELAIMAMGFTIVLTVCKIMHFTGIALLIFALSPVILLIYLNLKG